MNAQKGRSMKTNIILSCVVLLLAGGFLTGCEMTNNPLILDSSISVSTLVNVQTNSPIDFPMDTLALDIKALQDVAKDDVEKINFYNFTLTADNDSSTGTLSGYILIDGDTLAIIKSLAPSALTSERSIFENITGLESGTAGMGKLLHAVKNPPANPLKIMIFIGKETVAPVKFKLTLKVYCQIYSKS
jgi:hypothetical protein